MFLWKYVSSHGVFFVIVSLRPINWSGGGDNGQHSTLCGRVWQIGGCGSSIYSLWLFQSILEWCFKLVRNLHMVNPTCVLYDLITFGCFRKFLNKYSVNYSFDCQLFFWFGYLLSRVIWRERNARIFIKQKEVLYNVIFWFSLSHVVTKFSIVFRM